MHRRFFAIVALAVTFAEAVLASNCNGWQTGLIPLTALGAGTHVGVANPPRIRTPRCW